MEIKSKIKHHPTGFKTNVKNPNHFPMTPKGSDTLKSFLCSFKTELINKTLNCKTTKKNQISKHIEDLIAKIDVNKHLLVVLIDKTNSFRVLKTETYDASIKKHLLKSGKEVRRSRIMEIYGNDHKLLETHQESLSKVEYHAICSAIEKRDTSTQKHRNCL